MLMGFSNDHIPHVCASFKQDILVMDSKSPADAPASFLPVLIATFLAQFCDMSMKLLAHCGIF
jgi:hypothetical protein